MVDEAQAEPKTSADTQQITPEDLFGDDELSQPTSGQSEHADEEMPQAEATETVAQVEAMQADATAEPTEQTGGPETADVLDLTRYQIPGYTPESTICITKLPQSLRYESEQFDPMTYRETASSESEASPDPAHVIRWRNVVEFQTGKEKVESNSRIVKWSDGSMYLYIGNMALPISTEDISHEHHYIHIDWKQDQEQPEDPTSKPPVFTLQELGRVKSRLVVKPPTVMPRVKKAEKVRSVRFMATRHNPELEKKQLADLEADKNSLNDQLKKREQRREQELNTQFLEADVPEDNDSQASRRSTEEEERVAEQRLLEAKHGTTHRARKGHK